MYKLTVYQIVQKTQTHLDNSEKKTNILVKYLWRNIYTKYNYYYKEEEIVCRFFIMQPHAHNRNRCTLTIIQICMTQRLHITLLSVTTELPRPCDGVSSLYIILNFSMLMTLGCKLLQYFEEYHLYSSFSCKAVGSVHLPVTELMVKCILLYCWLMIPCCFLVVQLRILADCLC